MKPFFGAALTIALAAGAAIPARADDKDPTAILDKAIKATGGEEKLKKSDAMRWKTKATVTFNGDDNPLSSSSIVQGLDRFRTEFEIEIQGNPIKGVVVLAGDKGWRKFGDQTMPMDEDAVANEKHQISLHVIPTRLTILKEKGYKLESTDEAKVGDKPAAGIKVTGPTGKELTLYFDKESGLPVRTVARVVGFDGQEFTMETTLSDYKDFDGIKKATKSESKRDGEAFVKGALFGFKVLDKVEAQIFAEPKDSGDTRLLCN